MEKKKEIVSWTEYSSRIFSAKEGRSLVGVPAFAGIRHIAFPVSCFQELFSGFFSFSRMVTSAPLLAAVMPAMEPGSTAADDDDLIHAFSRTEP